MHDILGACLWHMTRQLCTSKLEFCISSPIILWFIFLLRCGTSFTEPPYIVSIGEGKVLRSTLHFVC